jgi:hypothetical protein
MSHSSRMFCLSSSPGSTEHFIRAITVTPIYGVFFHSPGFINYTLQHMRTAFISIDVSLDFRPQCILLLFRGSMLTSHPSKESADRSAGT